MNNKYIEGEKNYDIDIFKGDILRLLDHSVNDVFAEIIRATSDFNDLRNILSNLNKTLGEGRKFDLLGDSPEEILKANSVDKKMNYIQYTKRTEAEHVLSEWGVMLKLEDEIKGLRKIRNKLSHYNDANKYKNIDQVMSDLLIIECFMMRFKTQFPFAYSQFEAKLNDIHESAADFADKYNEKQAGYLKTNKITIETYCQELKNDILNEESIDTIRLKLYMAIGELGIDIVNGKISKDATLEIIKYFYKIKGKAFMGLENEKQDIHTACQNKQEIRCYNHKEIDNHKLQELIEENNILVDYRCLKTEFGRRFLKEKVIKNIKRGEKLFYIFESLREHFKLYDDKDPVVQFIKANMDVYGYMNAGHAYGNDEDRMIGLLKEKYPDKAFCVLTDSPSMVKQLSELERDALCIINLQELTDGNTKQEDTKNKGKDGIPYAKKEKVASIKNSKGNEEVKHFKSLFSLQKTCVLDANTVLEVSKIPDKGEYVYTFKGRKCIQLIDFISAGGEGSIYTTSESGVVAKIYFKQRITQNRKDKLILMTQNQPNIKNVCWPIDLLTNESGEFIGYIMAQALGNDMAKTIFKGRCGTYNRLQLVKILINIFEIISQLHRNNILLGDINGGNILIQSPEEIYFVDTDSYQIEGYPCPVGTELFTPPEIFKADNSEKKDFSSFLRTFGDERYALGVLAFLTVIPGATPYPMVEGKFQNGFRFPQNGKKAEGKLTYNCIWSYIHRQVKQLFWKVFDEGNRDVTVDKWIEVLKLYKDDIGDDEIKNQIFIKTYKDARGDTFVSDRVCPRCSMPLNITVDEYNRKAASGKEVWCKACTLKRNHMNNLTRFMYCSGCRRELCVSKLDYDRRIEKITTVACDRCSTRMTVYVNEYDKRRERGWDILCTNCDPRNGLYNRTIHCSECDPKNGVRLKYNVPSLNDILNYMD